MGTRLREETEYRPKPMVDVGGRPILWHIMKIYASYGYKDFILCLGYKGNVIKEYFYNYALANNDVTVELGKRSVTVHEGAENEDWCVTLANTGEEAQKGARLKKIEKYITGDTFMCTYGDGVADINIDALMDFHSKHGKLATLTGVRPPSLFGELRVQDGGRASLFVEKPQASAGVISGGFMVFNRRLFDYLSTDDACDLEKGTLERIAEAGELMVYVHEGTWACMDTYRDLQFLNQLWKTQRAFWKVW